MQCGPCTTFVFVRSIIGENENSQHKVIDVRIEKGSDYLAFGCEGFPSRGEGPQRKSRKSKGEEEKEMPHGTYIQQTTRSAVCLPLFLSVHVPSPATVQ